jgi:hypothetical protein
VKGALRCLANCAIEPPIPCSVDARCAVDLGYSRPYKDGGLGPVTGGRIVRTGVCTDVMTGVMTGGVLFGIGILAYIGISA